MNSLQKVWDYYNPIFLIDAEANLKKEIDLEYLVKVAALELQLESKNILVSYDKCFILFQGLTIQDIQKTLTTMQELWISLSRQLKYERYKELKFYGIYGKANKKYKTEYLAAFGSLLYIVNSIEELNPISYQKAIQGSFMALPL